MKNDSIAAARQYLQSQFSDFPVPERSYLILMIPRTGSNLLTTHLQQIDFGYPIEAFHFNHARLRAEYHWQIDFNDPAALMKKTIEFEMVNGIFGIKINWLQFQTFLQTAHLLLDPHNPDLTDKEMIEVFFPNPVFIFMKRLDKVKQAVSFSKGKQTGIWKVKVDQGDAYKEYVLPAVYDREHIEVCLEELLAFDVAWENYLRLHQIEHLTVWYENLANDFSQEMARIYQYLGIERDKIPAPVVRKLANESSRNWAARFRAETPWLEIPRIARGLQNRDFQTAFIERSTMLILEKGKRTWQAMPSTRFRSTRKFLLRVRRKLNSLVTR